MDELTLNIYGALNALRMGKCVCRKGWLKNKVWIKAQFPSDGSEMSVPYLFIEYAKGHPIYPKGCRVPWVLNHLDLFAEDYIILKNKKEA